MINVPTCCWRLDVCCGQKRRLRLLRLKELGGGVGMVRRAVELGKQWALDGADMLLPQLAEFLVSHEGLDFHSDESDGEGAVAVAHVATGEGAQMQQPMELQLGGHEQQPNKTRRAVRRIVMTHAFRSELAAHLLLELDRDTGVHRTLSPRVGAPLSARMAHSLLQRLDLTPLIDQDQVAAVAESKKRKGPWPLDGEDDSVQPMLDDSASLVSDEARSSRQAAQGGKAHRRCSPVRWFCMHEPLETAASGSKRVGVFSAATARADAMRQNPVSYSPEPHAHMSQCDACSVLTCSLLPAPLCVTHMRSIALQQLPQQLPPLPQASWSWTTTKSCGGRRRQPPSQSAALPKEHIRQKRISISSACWRSSSGAWRRSTPSSQHRCRSSSCSSARQLALSIATCSLRWWNPLLWQRVHLRVPSAFEVHGQCTHVGMYMSSSRLAGSQARVTRPRAHEASVALEP
jgi:hypothetical protein